MGTSSNGWESRHSGNKITLPLLRVDAASRTSTPGRPRPASTEPKRFLDNRKECLPWARAETAKAKTRIKAGTERRQLLSIERGRSSHLYRRETVTLVCGLRPSWKERHGLAAASKIKRRVGSRDPALALDRPPLPDRNLPPHHSLDSTLPFRSGAELR